MIYARMPDALRDADATIAAQEAEIAELRSQLIKTADALESCMNGETDDERYEAALTQARRGMTR